jgi:ribosomal protein S24E
MEDEDTSGFFFVKEVSVQVLHKKNNNPMRVGVQAAILAIVGCLNELEVEADPWKMGSK